MVYADNGEVTPSSFVRRAGAVALLTAGCWVERCLAKSPAMPASRRDEDRHREDHRGVRRRITSLGDLLMRNVFLVCYDVADDKRLRRTYKRMLGFGSPTITAVRVRLCKAYDFRD